MKRREFLTAAAGAALAPLVPLAASEPVAPAVIPKGGRLHLVGGNPVTCFCGSDTVWYVPAEDASSHWDYNTTCFRVSNPDADLTLGVTNETA